MTLPPETQGRSRWRSRRILRVLLFVIVVVGAPLFVVDEIRKSDPKEQELMQFLQSKESMRAEFGDAFTLRPTGCGYGKASWWCNGRVSEFLVGADEREEVIRVYWRLNDTDTVLVERVTRMELLWDGDPSEFVAAGGNARSEP